MNNKTPEVESETASKNLCKRGCGFYGSVQFNNMCSKCYQEFLKSEKSTQTSKNVSATYPPLTPNQSVLLNDLDILKKASLSRPETFACKRKLPASESSESLFSVASSESETVPGTDLINIPKVHAQRTVNRCQKCKKRVGLTGFQCRCEGLFCALHRYSDQHDCTFDYRKQGQDQIARDNPEVRCPKIRKI
ncbi:Zinc finger A20 and AN1 domain-containing stress-associated protein 9 [Echinococcus granulosus]|nr:Zinc finger A20 and AN1 domain-containing stress-associated protein 9 [Echinococcus granulosus]CDS16890.1 zinc finger A20 and AN1 domain containing protein [Echinococcus granulosus]